jgi:hypothetical protein
MKSKEGNWSAKYNCEQCNEEWEEVSSYEDDPVSTRCPLCSMPITQMIHDVFIEEGLLAVFKQLYLRLK